MFPLPEHLNFQSVQFRVGHHRAFRKHGIRNRDYAVGAPLLYGQHENKFIVIERHRIIAAIPAFHVHKAFFLQDIGNDLTHQQRDDTRMGNVNPGLLLGPFEPLNVRRQ